jgi:leucyl/phenylalanyl-tRNA--protein transferase
VAVQSFPPLEYANEHGLLAFGGDLEPESLILAYQSGIFPWPLDGEDELLWFSPPMRAVLYIDDFHVSRSLKKTISKTPFRYQLNSNCSEVITNCQSVVNRPKQLGTWITEEVKAAYLELHDLGYVHSFECYLGDNLVGGVYGVSINGVFAAESMFHRTTDASKAALWMLCQYLKDQGVKWIDCQIINPHLTTLGVIEISRDKYIEELKLGLSQPKIEFSPERLQQLLFFQEMQGKPK